MDQQLCKLNVVTPRAIAPALLEVFDSAETPLPGYTVVDAEGHGPDVALMTGAESVAGAMRASLIIMILPPAQVEAVKSMILAASPRPNIAYWVEPVLDYGRLVR